MHLELERELTDRRFAEVGHPYRIFRDTDGRFIAICSAFGLLGWVGRCAYEGQKLRHRVSVYTASSYERLAVLDVHFPINDVAFHPTESRIAIGTGGYDGGFMFEGELLLWNWATDASQSLLGENREVVRCRFKDTGGIVALLRPRDEEEYEDSDAFETYLGVDLDDLRPAREIYPESLGGDPRLAGIEPGDPDQWGFEYPKRQVSSISTADSEELKNHGFHERHSIGDVLWLNDETFAAVHQCCHIELWHLDRGCQASFHGDGHGIELLPYLHGGCLVHIFRPANYRTREPDRSALHWLRGNKLTVFRKFDHGCSFSTDSSGNILARDTWDFIRRERIRTDCVLDSVGNTVVERDLGSFDCFNHCLRLNGGRVLYFLRGTPPATHRNKVLCSVHEDGSTRELLAWDQGETHMMSSVAAFVSDQELIRACEIYHPQSPGRKALIERLSLTSGESIWNTPMEGCFTALATMRDAHCTVFSQTNGILGVIESSTGTILSQAPLVLDGIPTIATALATHGDRLLVGTIDGRLLLYRVGR